MARSKRTTPAPDPGKSPTVAESRWAKITWDALDRWAGGGAVGRGRKYQADGRVKKLCVAEDGDLLATVEGTERYATTVSLSFGVNPTLDSTCTCFIGFRCKHAVAVVADYIHALVDGRAVPQADDNDRRWDELQAVGDGGDFDDADDLGREDWDDEVDFDRVKRRQKASLDRAKARKATNADARWDAKIERHLRSRPQAELAQLAWDLARRFPEVHRELREQVALAEGDVAELLADARRAVGRATVEFAYAGGANGRGKPPDLDAIRQKLAHLLQLDQADAVVELGRDLIVNGLPRIAETSEEGDEYDDFAACLPPIMEAVARSSLGGVERLLFAVDADLVDDYDTVDDATEPIFAAADPAAWSELADALAERLSKAGQRRNDHTSGRGRLVDWLAHALEEAGRGAEVPALMEAEAILSGDYAKLVTHLIAAGRLDDAERWATQAIAARAERHPGDADALARHLRTIAERRKQWDVVAAYQARDFFDRPTPASFADLMKAARKAKCAEPVETAATHFLATGAKPYRFVAAPPRPKPQPKGKAKGKPAPAAASPPADHVQVDTAWPLPVPAALLPILKHASPYARSDRPHLDVLLQMALQAGDADRILHWYDRMLAPPAPGQLFSNAAGFSTEQVADAVAAAHPDRAIALLRGALDANLRPAEPSAYERVVALLRQLRPIYAATDRAADWDALVASIREQQRNRPRLLDLLDRLEPSTVAASIRSKRR